MYELPTDTVDGASLCQELAEIQDNCNYFIWDESGISGFYECTLFNLFDINNCQLVTGPAFPDMYDCLPEAGSHTCNDFAEVIICDLTFSLFSCSNFTSVLFSKHSTILQYFLLNRSTALSPVR